MRKIELPPKGKDWGGFLELSAGLALIMQGKGFHNKNDDDAELSQLLSCVEKCNKDYLCWDKVKYQKTPNGISNEKLWTSLKGFRFLSSQRISFGKYNFSYFITNQFQELLHKFDLEIGQLGGQYLLPEQDKQQFLISSIMEEAIASSQIEGAGTTRRVAKEFLRQNKIPRDASQQMILNNYLTIKHLSEIKFQNITPELVCEIQSMITKNTLEKAEYSEKFRDSDDIEKKVIISSFSFFYSFKIFYF